MNIKVGEYYYLRFRGKFRIWQKGDTPLGDKYYCDCFTKEEAQQKVKQLNNW